jgi:hypothetical protein
VFVLQVARAAQEAEGAGGLAIFAAIRRASSLALACFDP